MVGPTLPANYANRYGVPSQLCKRSISDARLVPLRAYAFFSLALSLVIPLIYFGYCSDTLLHPLSHCAFKN